MKLDPNSNHVLKIIPLGGLGEIGLNMMLFEYDDTILVVDAGVMFPEDHMLGIDMVIPDISYLRSHAERVAGIILTHGHEDHIGALPYIVPEISAPIYSTRLTLALVSEKLKEFQLEDQVTYNTVRSQETVTVGPFTIEFIPVCHSISDGVGLAIETPVGTVIHSGDFKIDRSPVACESTDLDRAVALDDILRGVVDEVTAKLGADRGTLYLLDHARGELVSRVAHLPEIAEIRP